MKLVAGALLLCLASATSAGTIVGGGATLPAIGYTGTATGTPIVPTTVSLFGVYVANHSGTAVTYCPTGSGAGKRILAGNVAGKTVNEACPSGFGGSGLTQPHFVASDAPLSTAEYNAYTTGHGATAQPTQLPAIAGAIGIVFKKSGVNALTLNEDQICGVFSGQIKTWHDLYNAGAVGISADITGDINIAYRSDGSGTSFSFLNHLSAVCPGVAGYPAISFKTLQAYATGAASYFSSYASSFSGDSNAKVIAVVAGTIPGAPRDGSIGYAEVANGVTAGVRNASVTDVNGVTFNPVNRFGPTAVPVTLTFDKVIADTTDLYGRPVLIDLPLTNGQPTSSNGCIAVVDPSTYANPASGTLGDVSLYPIIAITNLLGNKQGNPAADLTTVRGLLSSPYDTSIRSSVTKIGRAGTGYAWLSSSDLTAARVNSCIN
ncbi:substrate-binding domain-containing protein [Luteibacter sp. Lutesp34]|uniref:substrate-binding domain-containing protein n=1 Tax=Luteibacter sp. Lutesp34 TaxID=3243030 RepID=UPI0039B4AA87